MTNRTASTTTMDKMQSPSLGLSEEEVRQDSLAAEISGGRSRYRHLEDEEDEEDEDDDAGRNFVLSATVATVMVEEEAERLPSEEG